MLVHIHIQHVFISIWNIHSSINLLETFPYKETHAIPDSTRRILPPWLVCTLSSVLFVINYCTGFNCCSIVVIFHSPARVNVDSDKLSLKMKQLEAQVEHYKNQIHWLSTESRLHFGELKGHKVAILVEASDRLFQRNGFIEEYKRCLNQFINEQLVKKEVVYFIQFGSTPSSDSPTALSFSTNYSDGALLASEWVSSLAASGECDLMGAMNVALELENLDTIMVILSTQ